MEGLSPKAEALVGQLATIHPQAWILPGDDQPEINRVLNALAAQNLAAMDLLGQTKVPFGDGGWKSVQGAICARGLAASAGTRSVAMALERTRELMSGTSIEELITLLPRSPEEREGVLAVMSDQARGIARKALATLEAVVTHLVEEEGGLPEKGRERSRVLRTLFSYIKDETRSPATLKAAFQSFPSLRVLIEGPLAEEAMRRIEEASRPPEPEELGLLTDIEWSIVATARDGEVDEALLDIIDHDLNGGRDEEEVLAELLERAEAIEAVGEEVEAIELSDEEREIVETHHAGEETKAERLMAKLLRSHEQEYGPEARKAAMTALLELAEEPAEVEPEPAEPKGPTPEELEAAARERLERVLVRERRNLATPLKEDDREAAYHLVRSILELAEAPLEWADAVLSAELQRLVDEAREHPEVQQALAEGDPDGVWLVLTDEGWKPELADEVVAILTGEVEAPEEPEIVVEVEEEVGVEADVPPFLEEAPPVLEELSWEDRVNSLLAKRGWSEVPADTLSQIRRSPSVPDSENAEAAVEFLHGMVEEIATFAADAGYKVGELDGLLAAKKSPVKGFQSLQMIGPAHAQSLARAALPAAEELYLEAAVEIAEEVVREEYPAADSANAAPHSPACEPEVTPGDPPHPDCDEIIEESKNQVRIRRWSGGVSKDLALAGKAFKRWKANRS